MKRRIFTSLSLMALIAAFMLPMVTSAQQGKSPTEPGAVLLPVTTKTYMVRGNPPIWHFEAEATNNTGAEIPQGTKIYWKGWGVGTGMFTLFNGPIPVGGKFKVVHLSNPNGPSGPMPSSVQAWFYKP